MFRAPLFHADHDMAHYADGRPVMGRLRMCDGSQYLQPWHPDAFQDTSREIRTVTTGTGARQRIVVSAPGPTAHSPANTAMPPRHHAPASAP
jgi:hypothetical protein